MSVSKATKSSWSVRLKLKLADYAALTKFRLSSLVLFSAVIGYFMGASSVEFLPLTALCVGGFLVTGASNTINQIIERDIDKLMTRTANRPLPTGRVSGLEASLAAGLMGVGGIFLISSFSVIAGLLSAISLMTYAFIYTPLKRVHPIAVFVGAIPGALPTAIGYVFVTGTIDKLAILLFAIQFFWQFPHFWAIAWVSFEDYLKAGIMLLPSPSGKTKASAAHAMLFTAMLIPVGFMMYDLNFVGLLGTIIITLCGLLFLAQSVVFWMKPSDKTAKALMFGSFAYLPFTLLALVIDKV
jgi:protoheme IX farnesyltransferase